MDQPWISIYLTGVILIFSTSTPAAQQHNVSLGGFIAGMITAGLGLGGLKACVPPFMGLILKSDV
jgi:dipeptide/tripeptide permease